MNPNIIITDPSRNLRALGRNALSGKWNMAIVAVAVYLLCIQLPPLILNSLFGINIADLYGADLMYSVGTDTYNAIYSSMPEYSPLAGLYVWLVSGALELGITLFFLAMFRKQNVSVSDTFLGFEKFGKALKLWLFKELFIMLWTCLFIVPGIIARIRYSQVFFILADDPNKSIRQCMDESKAMMNGNKLKCFCLYLSFIGWCFLACLAAVILIDVAGVFQLNDVVLLIVSIIAALFLAPVYAYGYSTFSGFYEILAGHLIKETEPAPLAPEPIPSSEYHDDMRF